jgi:putative ABC transport system ATP-binding protein
MPVLVAKEVAKSFVDPSGRQVKVLRGVSLTVERGELVAVVGRSGSGKSSLLAQIGLLDRPDTGSLSIAGIETTNLSESRRCGLRADALGMVFQQFYLDGSASVLDNVAEARLTSLELPRGRRARQAEATSLLEQFGISHLQNRPARVLSGGEQQRVAIARSLMNRPEVLLADEPTGSLDPDIGLVVMEAFAAIAATEASAVVLVTHDMQLAQLCDRQLVLSDGVLNENPPL